MHWLITSLLNGLLLLAITIVSLPDSALALPPVQGEVVSVTVGIPGTMVIRDEKGQLHILNLTQQTQLGGQFKVGDKVLFLVEAKQAGIFEIRNVPAEQLQGIVGVVCPQMVYPYLRAVVSDVCTRAGFPPILLTEVNFQAMFEAQAQQAAAAANGNGGAAGSGGSRIITGAN